MFCIVFLIDKFLLVFELMVDLMFKTSRYFMNPSLEVVRCFGVEYTAEELAEEISKEMKKAST